MNTVNMIGRDPVVDVRPNTRLAGPSDSSAVPGEPVRKRGFGSRFCIQRRS